MISIKMYIVNHSAKALDSGQIVAITRAVPGGRVKVAKSSEQA